MLPISRSWPGTSTKSIASPTRALVRLRSGPDRVLARIVDDEVVFDFRTVEPFEDGLIARRIGELATGR